MSIWAYSQDDAKVNYGIQPFDDKDGQYSFLTAMVSADPDNNRIYAMNAGTGQFAAINLNPDKPELLSLDWMVNHSSFSFMSLIGTSQQRVIVASDIPKLQLPGSIYSTPYQTEQVVWRDAASGTELACNPLLPAMSQGAALSPGVKGVIYYPGANGQVIELSVDPA